MLDEIQRDALDGSVPLASTLRKLMALGGTAGSTELRDWAARELRGYLGSGVELPEYRKTGAVILVNAINGNTQITGQQVSPHFFPESVREHIKEEVVFAQAIGEIEAMLQRAEADGGYIKLTLPGAQDLATITNHEVGDPFQQITAVYWNVAAPSINGVVDQVRTTLVELIAEMQAGLPGKDQMPSADLANQAVNVVVHGKGARVNVSAPQTTGDGSSQSVAANIGSPSEPSNWRRIGAFIVGVATIAGTLIALAAWQGWVP